MEPATQTPQSSHSVLKYVVGITLTVVVIAGGIFAYKYFKKPSNPTLPDSSGDSATKEKQSATENVDSATSGAVKSDSSEPVKKIETNGGGYGKGTGSLGIFKTSVVKSGTKGSPATYAQQALNKMGANLQTDGDFGVKSVAALSKITGKTSITLGELQDIAAKKGYAKVFGFQL